ncbi:MAG: hypothetical protein LUG18_05675 [Candidatus Azobacteroides sp.]|nr:hypothetical protein [Candidatus Azobacteroides sp.]
MWKRSIFLFIFYFHSFLFYANPAYQNIKSLGMGQTGISSSPINPSGTSFLKEKSIYLAHKNNFSLSELAEISAQISIPNKIIDLGVCFFRYGYEYYNENTFGLNVSRKLSNQIALGIRINYYTVYISETDGNPAHWNSDLGILWKFNSDFSFGFLWTGFLRKKQEKLNKEKTAVQFGLSYFILPILELAIEANKTEKDNLFFKSGINSEPLENLFFRVGIYGNPVQPTFGLGYKIRECMFDFAVTNHTVLGISSGISLTYYFR